MKSLSKSFFFGLLFLFIAQNLTASESFPDEQKVKGILKQRIDVNQRSVGIVVGLVDENGSQVISYGEMKKGGGQTPDGKSVFEIGSISKAFTGILLADMVQRGKLKLDDPVGKFLPKDVKMPGRGGKQITLLNLTQHTSALPRLPSNMNAADPKNPYADYTIEMMYEFLSGHELERDIGEKAAYSNLGAGLLGHALALKAGKSYEELMIERIAKPLGMKDTRIALTEDMKKRLATGHNQGGEPTSNWDIPALAGAGAIRSTVDDMIIFMQANLGLKKSKLSKAMQASHGNRTDFSVENMEVGLGWIVSNTDQGDIIWHNGGTGGYRTFCGFDKEKKRGVVVLTNSANSADDIGLHLLDSKNELAKFDPPPKETEVNVDKLADYAGKYQLAPGFFFTVTPKEDKLFVQITGQPEAQVYPESEDKFFYKIVDAQIKFNRDDNGAVKELVLFQNGREQTAKKLGEGEKAEERKEIAVDEKIMAQYVGKYQLAPTFIMTITLENGALFVQATGQPKIPVFAESETKFFAKVVPAQISFVKGDDGKVSHLILHQGGMDQKATRMEE